VNLLDDIPENVLVGIDAVIWIYEFERNAVFGPMLEPFFRDRLNTGKNRAGASVLTLGEVLVKPLSLGRMDLVAAYRTTFSSRPGFDVWDAARNVVEKAAELRARYKLKMMDALHVASAVVNRADLFLTNDDGLRRVTEIKVLVLKDYLPGAGP
jgi:predicted nucleic acid-binding protein